MGNVYMEAEQVRYKSDNYRTVQEGLDAAFAGSPEGLGERVTALETTVGDSSAGLVKDVDDLQTTVGDSSAGLVKDVDDLQATVGGAIQWDDAVTSVKKNLLPLSLKDIKEKNTIGTWAGNIYTVGSGTFEVITDSNGLVTGIRANGTFAQNARLIVYSGAINNGNYILNKGYSTTPETNIGIGAEAYNGSTWIKAIGESYGRDDSSMVVDNDGYDSVRVTIIVPSAGSVSNLMIYPMIRLSTVTDNTFVPYILDNVELANAIKYEESAFTNVPEGATVTTNKLIKFGKVVMACATISGITTAEWTTFLSIPDGFRPKTNFKVIDISSSWYYTVFSGGYVQSSAALSANAIEIFATWITE